MDPKTQVAPRFKFRKSKNEFRSHAGKIKIQRFRPRPVKYLEKLQLRHTPLNCVQGGGPTMGRPQPKGPSKAAQQKGAGGVGARMSHKQERASIILSIEPFETTLP